MHDIAHPQLPGLLKGKAASVGIGVLAAGFFHQAMTGEQAVHCRIRQGEIFRDLGAFACLADNQLYRELRIAFLDTQQHVDHLRGQRARLAAVGTWLGYTDLI